MTKKIIHLIAAARPNFMKIAPLYHALKKTDWADPVIVHTGQHYDLNMSGAFFNDLMLPVPHYHLGVGSGTHKPFNGRPQSTPFPGADLTACPKAATII
jgi:UDP-N-acetylglucosamine 2-epimerase (non-hydrolysing)